MKTVDLLRLSSRMFKSRMSRTILTITGVSVGIATILFLVSMGYGLQRLLLEKITTSEALLTVDVTAGSNDAFILTNESLEEFTALEGVEKVSPQVDLPAQIAFDDLTSDVLVHLTQPDFFSLSGMETIGGALFEEGDTQKIVVSQAFSLLFGLDDTTVIGSEVDLTLFVPEISTEEDSGGILSLDILEFDEPFEIVGLLADDAQPMVFVPLDILSTRAVPFYQLVKVKMTATEFLEPVRQHILDLGFSVSALSDLVDQANKIFFAFQIILAIFGVFALIVSAIGLINTMTIALLERTQEIGVMKSIGAARRDIANLFLMESSMIGFLGGFFGVLLGYGAGEGFNLFVNILAKNLGGDPVDLFDRPLWFIATIIVFSTVVGVIAGIMPSRRAAKINPLSAIKYK